jgi:lipid-A-disaccharide synthase
MVLHVAPAVWAWKPERAAALRPLFDAVLAVLPFEPAVMARLGGPPTSYVGHPGLGGFAFRPVQPREGPLLLLPGSRSGELRRHLPLMRALAERLAPAAGREGFVLPTPPGFRAALADETATWRAPVRVVSAEADKAAAFAAARAACAVTGTVTLELMLAGVPMVATYVADRGQERRFRRYGVRFAALPNILLDRAVVPEHLFVTPDPGAVADDFAALLASPERIAAQRDAFAEARALMEKGAPEAPLADPAERVLSLLGQSPQRPSIGW